jgi:hypothetical protein
MAANIKETRKQWLRQDLPDLPCSNVKTSYYPCSREQEQ